MSIEPRMAFFNASILGKPDSLETIIHGIQKIGYSVRNFHVGTYPMYLASWDEVSETNQDKLEIAYSENYLSFIAYNLLEEFELNIQLFWNIEMDGIKGLSYISAVTFQTALFHTGYNKAVHYSNVFLEFGKQLFSIVQPEFGWIEKVDPSGYTSFNDIAQLSTPHIYWATFFGRAYIEKYGKMRLLSSPAMHSEYVDSGGIIIVLSQHLEEGSDFSVQSYFDNLVTTR
jgi:hypothetical protein